MENVSNDVHTNTSTNVEMNLEAKYENTITKLQFPKWHKDKFIHKNPHKTATKIEFNRNKDLRIPEND